MTGYGFCLRAGMLCCCFIFFSSMQILAQRPGSDNTMELKRYEDTLIRIADLILDGAEQGIRQDACYEFIRKLVQALKLEGSYNYPFDSLKRISILYPDDRSFRIFNWQLPLTTGKQRYFGAIQMADEEVLKLYPLYDYSDNMMHAEDTITDNERWYGALYYRILEVKGKGKKYYTLLGWDGHNMRSNKKIIEILSFTKEGSPLFGAPVFYFGKESELNDISRFIIEYKEDAQVSLNYDTDLQLITFDHLVPQDASTKDLPFTYVPDGSYEAFEWKKGMWRHIENIFTSTMKEAPFPDPVDFSKDRMKRK